MSVVFSAVGIIIIIILLLSFALGHQSGVQRNSTLHHMLEEGCSFLSDLVHHLLPEKSEQCGAIYHRRQYFM